MYFVIEKNQDGKKITQRINYSDVIDINSYSGYCSYFENSFFIKSLLKYEAFVNIKTDKFCVRLSKSFPVNKKYENFLEFNQYAEYIKNIRRSFANNQVCYINAEPGESIYIYDEKNETNGIKKCFLCERSFPEEEIIKPMDLRIFTDIPSEEYLDAIKKVGCHKFCRLCCYVFLAKNMKDFDMKIYSSCISGYYRRQANPFIKFDIDFTS